MSLSSRLSNFQLNQIKHIKTTFTRAASEQKALDPKQTTEIIEKLGSNWISYGFNTESKKRDRLETKAAFFSGITIGLVLTGYVMMYSPDVKMKHWASREAFLELRRREEDGAALIDPNLVKPEKVKLPSEDELCDVEVII